MNREDIIRMAREAGLKGLVKAGWIENLERFAALVAAAEREACAEVCIDQTMIQPDGDYNDGCFACYDTICKRGEK